MAEEQEKQMMFTFIPDEAPTCQKPQECELPSLQHQIKLLWERHDDMHDSLQENTRITHEIKKDTEDLVTLLKNAKAGLRAVNIIVAGIKWLAGVGFAIVTLYYILTTGKPPPHDPL